MTATRAWRLPSRRSTKHRCRQSASQVGLLFRDASGGKLYVHGQRQHGFRARGSSDCQLSGSGPNVAFSHCQFHELLDVPSHTSSAGSFGCTRTRTQVISFFSSRSWLEVFLDHTDAGSTSGGVALVFGEKAQCVDRTRCGRGAGAGRFGLLYPACTPCG